MSYTVTKTRPGQEAVTQTFNDAPVTPAAKNPPTPATPTSNTSNNLSQTGGSVGHNMTSIPTAQIQQNLGASADGIYGSQTTAAVKAFQQQNGLVVDGIFGPKTQAAYEAKYASPGGASGSTEDAGATNQLSKTPQQQIDEINAHRDQAFQTFQKSMNQITNGSVPLNTGQKAQIAGLTQQYQALIDQQKETNQNALGTARAAAYRGGAAEGTDLINNTINPIIAKGTSLVADLNTKLASAVAALTEGFQKDDIAAIKDAWDEYNSYESSRTDALNKTIDDANKAIQQQFDNNIKLQQLNLDKQKIAQSAGSSDNMSLAMQLVNGMIAPSELSKRTSNYNGVLQAADEYSMLTTGKHFDVSKADRDYKFANNAQTQNTLNYLKSLTGTIDPITGKLAGGNFDELQNASNAINRTNFPALNNASKWAKLESGDPQIAAYQAVAAEVADQMAKILQGGGSGSGTSDAKLQQAVNLFNTGFSKDQLNAIIDSMKPLLANRAKAIVGDNPYLSDYADELGVNSPSNVSNADFFDSLNTTVSNGANDIYSPGSGFIIPTQ